MTSTQRIFDWLLDGAPGAADPAQVVERLCADLVAARIPVARIAVFVRTLHPHIMGRSFIWRRGAQVQVFDAPYDTLQTPEYLNSPAAMVTQSGQILRRRIADPGSPRDFPFLDELAAQGITDYLAGPLTFLSGQVHVITFASQDAGGFTDADVTALTDLLRPLARVAEIFALRRTAVTLLNTYVGHNAGERILAGKIQRGDTDSIRAVLWFSDLRGFTALASSVEPGTMIRALNDLFECQVAAIERHGGEVLKFMGDGLLAIFRIDGAARTPAELCDAALDAARDAFAAVTRLNQARAERCEPPLRFGLALHIGEVAYGNIGSVGRLDFTCIGPAVNIASRLEGLTGRLGRPVLVSEQFAQLTTRPMTRIGSFELKGVPELQAVFGPAEGPPLAAW